MVCLGRRANDDPGPGPTSGERARNVGLIFLAVALIVLISHIIVRYWIKPSVLPPSRPGTPQPEGIESVGQLPGPRLSALHSRKRPKPIRLEPDEIDIVAPELLYSQVNVRPVNNDFTHSTLRAPSPIMSPVTKIHRYSRNQTLSDPIDATPSNPFRRPSPRPPSSGVTKGQYDCSICLEGFEDDDLVRETLCGHIFHKKCLEWWLTKHRSRCPLCQNDFKPNGILSSLPNTTESASGK
ncbi:hypothetical protein F5Y04DRAFT_124056 [Hypomontagnella monticulosa]|nr:hypothetical protein F5Y04DRAFT_124056 [Hypomontagnella monticulosa]